MSNTKTVMGQAANTQGIPLDITDVFSTYLYEGTAANQTINNNIDLSGEGGLVWIKGRTNAQSHGLFDTERGVSKALASDANWAEFTYTGVNAFYSNGFRVGYQNEYNQSGLDYASWTFRKAPKFFDVQTWSTTYNTVPYTLSVNLDGTLGMAIFKSTDATGQANNWIVWHKDLSDKQYLRLNDTTFVITDTTYGPSYNSSTKEFTFRYPMSVAGDRLISGGQETTNWVGYFFAHNDGDGDFGPTGDQDIIKCGSYTGTGAPGHEVNLGFEPQWLLTKRIDSANSWYIVDNMRGFTGYPATSYSSILKANTTDYENQELGGAYWQQHLTSTGFVLDTGSPSHNASGGTYIYMAIRRGPLAQPKSGTEVFAVKRHAGADGPQPAGITSDMLITTNSEVANTERFNFNRLTNGKVLYTSQTFAEGNYSAYLNFGTNNGVNTTGFWGNTSVPLYYHFKRAPGFCDVVAYTGNSTSGRTVSHNLGVAPEMMWIKRRDITASWCVYHSAIGATGSLDLDNSGASNAPNAGARFDDTEPTSSVFTVGNFSETNNNNNTYIAYLFATLPGVSKVGSYTGNGTSQTIDCGFTSGARFTLIKRTDSTGDWYIWDTERGIVAANDPHLSLNTTAAEVTSDDSIDPDNSGFIVNQVGATNINVSSANYIFYAIA